MNSSPPPPDPFESQKIIRRASIGDIEAVIQLAKAIPTAAQWSCVQYETYCATERQAETHAKALFVACVLAPDQTVVGKDIIGFAAFSAIPNTGGGDCELENMAVAELWRRRGMARRLLVAGQLWCRAWCPADTHDFPAEHGLSLEVRASNQGAVLFYQHLGFSVNGCRPGYYKQPDDDAILMWKSLNVPPQTL